MDRKDDLYNRLSSFAHEQHEKNRKRIKVSGIVLLLLPVALELIRLLTGSDKTVFLIIWILCMFVISAYLVSVEYFDYRLQNSIGNTDDTEEGGNE